MRHRITCGLGMLLALGGVALAQDQANRPAGLDEELAAPVKVLAGGNAINVDVGHAAPFWGDFDGDGTNDLLVGQFGDGKLRIYKNQGSNTEPKFSDFEWFKAGGAEGTVPFG